MSSYGNYVQGSVNTTNNGYNLLVTGAPTGSTQSSVMIGGDTSTTYGVRIVKDSSNNGYIDLRSDPNNTMSIRHQDNTTGTITSMLSLSNDNSLTGTGYGATVNGRVNASAYYVGQVDSRTPSTPGVYMSMDNAHVGKFATNKGSGTGGFQFSTFNSNGTLAQNNMNLKPNGTIQTPYYKATNASADFASVAVAGIDASGNLVRNYQINTRLRSIQSRITALQYDLIGNTPNKINEVVTRLNDLNFFSQPIGALAPYDPNNPPVYVSPSPSPAPVGVSGLYAFSTFTFTPNGATGSNGPTTLTYNTSTYPWIPQYLTLASGIQQWTVPATTTYTLTAAGAQGGTSQNGNVGGNGVIVSNQLVMTQGDVLYILAGQKGLNGMTNQGAGGGGGGATYVVRYNGGATTSSSSYTILLVAGGGGGGGFASAGANAVTTTQGGLDTQNINTPAINGAGGTNNASQGWLTGCGGGGWSGTGVNSTDGLARGGTSFLNGGAGGAGDNGGAGGFGGGAGSGVNWNWGTGGGGGYSGGSSGSLIQTQYDPNKDFTGAGGGGSYDLNGSEYNATASGYNSGDGYFTIAASSAISGPISSPSPVVSPSPAPTPAYTLPTGLISSIDASRYTSASSIADVVTGVSWNMSGVTYNSTRKTLALSSGYILYNGGGVGPANFNATVNTQVIIYYRNGNSPNGSNAILFNIGRDGSHANNESLFSENNYWDYTNGYGIQLTGTNVNNSTGWVMRAFVKNGNVGTMYLNGQPDGTVTSVSSNIGNVALCIGRDYRDNYNFLNGEVYWAGIWNVALTPAQILAFYNAYNPASTPPPPAPTITTQNMVMYLDAGNTSSYPGSGATWTDTASGLSFNLKGSPVYSSANGGYLTFSTGQWAQSTAAPSFNLPTFSVEVWHYYTGTNNASNNHPAIVCQSYGVNGNDINYVLGTSYPTQNPNTVGLGYYKQSGGWISTAQGYALTPNNWYHIVGTYDGTNMAVYINGVVQIMGTSTATPLNGNAPINLMKRWDQPDYWAGRLAVVRIYSSALTAPQVAANLTAERARFGI